MECGDRAMKSYRTSRTGLFLIELIISIFFFIVSCAVIVQLFVKSYAVSQEAVSFNNALLYSQNIAELFLGNDGSFEAVKSTYSDIEYNSGDDFLLLLFDKDWEPVTGEANAMYSVCAQSYVDDSFSYVDIYVCKYFTNEFISSNEYIYFQSVKKYRGKL